MADNMRGIVVHLSDVMGGRGYLGNHSKWTLIFSIDYTLFMGGWNSDGSLDARGAAVLLQHVLVVVVTLVESTSLSST